MTAALAATIAVVLVAIVATYFVARAAKALAAIRADVVALRVQAKAGLTQAQKTERAAARVSEKFYRQTKDLESMLADPTVQRALRQEGRS